ncbi:MAG: helix-turn-helix domain-containing protein [Lachnospiraceae bacterium]|nr:helix-turn-helix domain-containing protein [Lachnospiraceae bacterium]
MLGQGKSRKQIQREFEISAATFYRYKNFINI